MEARAILQQFPFFREGSADLRAEVESRARPARIARGAFFFTEGSACAQFALVGAGSLRVYKVDESGREVTLYHVHAGETCPVNLLCALLGSSSPASAVAETEVEALIVDAATLRRWIDVDEGVRHYAFESIGQRLIRMMTLVEEITFRRLDERLAEFLSRRFAEVGGSGPEIAVTHEEIALELGSVREVVSRLLKEFDRVGAIRLGRGRIGLRDDGALRRFLPRS